jgi:hypothetical protein
MDGPRVSGHSLPSCYAFFPLLVGERYSSYVSSFQLSACCRLRGRCRLARQGKNRACTPLCDEFWADVVIVSPSQGTLKVYSWGRDDCVKGWDGLLAVEWMGEPLTCSPPFPAFILSLTLSRTPLSSPDANTLRREAEFCSYRNLTLLSCSWNIDSCKPADLTSTTENASFLTSVLQSENNPDIIVFGFQELIDLDSKKLQASPSISPSLSLSELATPSSNEPC